MPAKKSGTEIPVRHFKDQAAFEKWLADHHESSSGIWLRIAKKNAALRSVSYAEALDVALCFGWIDSQSKKLDDESYVQRFTPRGPKSLWSKINREKVAALEKAGRMQAPGIAAVLKAKADGRWDAAYDSPSTATVPEDLQAALNRNRAATKFFATLNAANRYAVIWRVQTAKRAETRAKRIATLVEMLARGERIHS